MSSENSQERTFGDIIQLNTAIDSTKLQHQPDPTDEDTTLETSSPLYEFINDYSNGISYE